MTIISDPIAPKITIVTVVYNGAHLLKKTIDSILSQALPPYEYIVVDGKSTDGTLELAQGYQNAFSKKGIIYTILSEKDAGLYDAMNKGIDLTTGDYIAFIGAGDWYEDNAVQVVTDLYYQTAFDLCFGDIYYVNSKGTRLIKKSKIDWVVSSRNWNHPSMFLKTEIYKKHKFDLSFRLYADFNLYLKLRRDNVDTQIIKAEKPIVNFTCGGVSNAVSVNSFFKRTAEKKRAYYDNGYSLLYVFEVYAWEFIKYGFCLIFGR